MRNAGEIQQRERIWGFFFVLRSRDTKINRY